MNESRPDQRRCLPVQASTFQATPLAADHRTPMASDHRPVLALSEILARMEERLNWMERARQNFERQIISRTEKT